MIKILSRFTRSNWFVPVVSLILTALSYALLSPQLGFYLDDWPQLYSFLIRGTEGIKTYFLYDGRPYGYWPDLFFYNLWGTNPLLWHLTNYFLRWLTGMFMWITFRQLWPENKREVGWAVIFFAVFPLFGQQSMGLTFIAHWMCYLLFFISLCLMVAAARSKRFTLPLLFLSVAVNIPNLFTYENFIGVEFIRPFIFWFAFSDEVNARKRIKRVVKYWLPYLLVALFYIVWRLFLLDNIRSDNSPVLLLNLVHEPGKTLVQLLTFIAKDTIQMILGVWYPVLDSDIVDFTNPTKNISLLLSALVISISIIYLLRIRQKNNETSPENRTQSFNLQAIIIGLAGIILGCAPGWLVMRTVTGSYGVWNDRFGLPAMWAASLFLVGMIGLLLKQNRLSREILFVVLIGMAVGYNFTVTDDYRKSSDWQNQFFSQLKWRAPYIESRTSLLADNEMFPKMGVYPTSFALNLLYPSVELMPRTDYWFFTLHKYFPDDLDKLESGISVFQRHWYAQYEGESQNSLVIDWSWEESHCLWVLTENDQYNPEISDNTIKALGASDLNRIDPTGEAGLPSEDLFGREDQNTWCYYYEKADLARQTEDWDEIVRLYQESQSKGYSPTNGIELMPFIEGFAHTGDADTSYQLTMDATHLSDNLSPFLCDNWNRIAPDVTGNADVNQVYQSFFNDYGCMLYLDE